ncbi:MAG: M20 family metallopeptidase [Prochloraceae cyanobacterium]|nr:M20 family metallopeptidase [Prochloraceae cyanobacterium]
MQLKTTSTQTARRLLDYLHGRTSEMTNLLEKLVLAESPSLVPAAQIEVLALLEKALLTRNYRVQRLLGRQTGGHLLAIPSARRKNQPVQLLLGHCDTVWPVGTLAKMPLKVRQGKMYGPGTYDMKAGLVTTIFAVEALQALEIEPEIAPVILINSDEEIGSHSSRIHIQRLAKVADRAFVMEPSLGPSGKLKTERKGVGRFTIRVMGKAAHAGLEPEKGASAILELSFIIQKLFALNDAEKGITINVGTIDGGIRPNVIAPESKAVVDVRVLRQEDARQIEKKILSIEPSTPGTQLVIEGGIGRKPMEKTPGNQKLWQLAQSAAYELGIEIEQGTAGGGSDGNITSLWTPTLDGLGAVGDGAHAPGEFVYLDRMVERSALLSRLLLEPSLQ